MNLPHKIRSGPLACVHSVEHSIAIKNKLRSKKKNALIQKGIHAKWSHLSFVFYKKGVKQMFQQRLSRNKTIR